MEKLVVRKTKIEILRIIAMFLIVLDHVACRVISPVNLNMACTDVSHIVLGFFYMSGSLGNLIFIIISSWFLLDSTQVKIKKIIYFVIELWLISIISLTCFSFFYRQPIDVMDILRSIFPPFFNTFWFVTCYLLVYGGHTVLNKIIKQFSQRELLNATLALFFLYILCNNIMEVFFTSPLILWITLYFVCAYMKLYLPNLANNKKVNLCLLVLGLFGLIIITIMLNFLGLRYEIFHDKILHFGYNRSVFWLGVAIGLFNIFRTMKVGTVLPVNKIAHYMFLVYLIHGNVLSNNYSRLVLFNYGYDFLGQKNIVLLVLLYSVFLFVVSVLLAIIFEGVFKKLLKKTTDVLCDLLSNIYLNIQKIVLKLD